MVRPVTYAEKAKRQGLTFCPAVTAVVQNLSLFLSRINHSTL